MTPPEDGFGFFGLVSNSIAVVIGLVALVLTVRCHRSRRRKLAEGTMLQGVAKENRRVIRGEFETVVDVQLPDGRSETLSTSRSNQKRYEVGDPVPVLWVQGESEELLVADKTELYFEVVIGYLIAGGALFAPIVGHFVYQYFWLPSVGS